MAQFVYRLRLLLEQKEEAKKAAERELAQRQKELEAQQEHLVVLRRREQELVAKRDRLRRELLNNSGQQDPLTAYEVRERAEFVKVMGVQIEEAKNAVLMQRTVVETCDMRVQKAKSGVEETKREVEILTKHRAKQEERFMREERAKEELELDEIGNVLFTTRRRTS